MKAAAIVCMLSGLGAGETAEMRVSGGPGAVPAACAQASAATLDLQLVRTIEGNERAAYRSLFAAAAAVHGPRSFEVAEQGGALLFVSPLVRHPGVFNRVLGIGLEAPLDPRELRQIERAYASRGLGLALDVAPQLLAPEASAELRALGLRRGALSAMVVQRRPQAGVLGDGQQGGRDGPRVADGLRVVKAETAAERGTAAAICAGVFAAGDEVARVLQALEGSAGWQHWLAYQGSEPAGAGLSFIADGRCWLGWAATLPEFRRRGVKGALDDVRTAHAGANGCQFISSDTAAGTAAWPDHSLKSFKRRGFEVAYQRATYLRLAPAPEA